MNPPVILTFLAPADRCNQHCPGCFITDVAGEPVHQPVLSPLDYARFVEAFVEAGVPIRSVKFQGYEVTLPASWGYLEAVFAVAKREGIHRSFITNGMLLSRWTDRIRDLKPARISVSLDGSTAEANDRYRGLTGAFDATLESVRRFLAAAPEFRESLGIASTLRDESSFDSLLGMPRLLRRIGITRWLVTVELGLIDGLVRPSVPRSIQATRLRALKQAAEAEGGVRCHINDEFGFFRERGQVDLHLHRVPTPAFFYRLDPTGGIRRGAEMFRIYDSTVRRWNPASDDPLETVSYHEAARTTAPAVSLGQRG